MQFSLPTATPELLPIAPAATEADAALLVVAADGAPVPAFAAVLDEEGIVPILVGTNAKAIVPKADPRAPGAVDRIEAPVATPTESANILTAPTTNLLAAPRPVATQILFGELAAGQSPADAVPAEQATNSRPLIPRPLTKPKAPAFPSRAEEEQAAALALTTNVLVFTVGPLGDLTPAPTEGLVSVDEAPAMASLSNKVEVDSDATLTTSRQMSLRSGKISWITNNPVTSPSTTGGQKILSGGSVNYVGLADELAQASDNQTTAPDQEGAEVGNNLPAPIAGIPVRMPVRTGAKVAVDVYPSDSLPRSGTPENLRTSPPPAPTRPGEGSVQELETAILAASSTAGASKAVADSTQFSAWTGTRSKVEKNSALAGRLANVGEIGSDRPGLKKILNPESQSDSETLSGVGTGVAEANGKMRHDSQPPFAAFQQVEEISIASTAVAGLREAMATLAPPIERVGPQVAAPIAAPRMHAVVNHVVEASQRLDTQTVSSMAMRFNFGGDDKLSVQVELRNGAVHTVFRTDSETLRETLGTAWREMAPANTIAEGRTVRLAEPTIVRESPSTGFSTQSGGGDQRFSHQQQPQQQSTAEFAEASFALAAGRSRAVRRLAALVEPAPAPLSLRPETVRHLHAVA